MSANNEEKNRRIALFTTIGVNSVLLLILLFAIAWRAPDPPIPDYGIELNFGMDSQGSGDIQPETPVGDESDQNEEQTAEEVPEETTDPSEAVPDTPAPSETAVEESTNKMESPVVVKEQKEEVKKPVERPVEKPVEKKPEPVKEEVKPVEKKPDPKPLAVYKPSTNSNDATGGKEGTAGSQGDDANKAGDKGSPEGNVDAKALYGKPGGGGDGSSLDLAGWDWDEIPRPNIPDNQTGRIVFEIEVDDRGEIVKFRPIEKTVSAEAERACREAIQKLTFSKKPGAVVPAISKGKITFIIRAK